MKPIDEMSNKEFATYYLDEVLNPDWASSGDMDTARINRIDAIEELTNLLNERGFEVNQ